MTAHAGHHGGCAAGPDVGQAGGVGADGGLRLRGASTGCAAVSGTFAEDRSSVCRGDVVDRWLDPNWIVDSWSRGRGGGKRSCGGGLAGIIFVTAPSLINRLFFHGSRSLNLLFIGSRKKTLLLKFYRT